MDIHLLAQTRIDYYKALDHENEQVYNNLIHYQTKHYFVSNAEIDKLINRAYIFFLFCEEFFAGSIEDHTYTQEDIAQIFAEFDADTHRDKTYFALESEFIVRYVHHKLYNSKDLAALVDIMTDLSDKINAIMSEI